MTTAGKSRRLPAAALACGTLWLATAWGSALAAPAAPGDTPSPRPLLASHTPRPTTSRSPRPSPTPTAPDTRKNWVSVGQTVLAATDATGKISGTPRVFTQLIANGAQPATVRVPTSTVGFRNLLGLQAPPIEDGEAVWHLDLNGQAKERSVAHFASESLPLSITAHYALDGRAMKASQIVGKSGTLKATYTIRNITSRSTTVTFRNLLDHMQTVTTSAPVPIAAAFNITFPSTFTNLSVPKASTYGLGDATTSASWTLFAFKPLGALEQTVGYEAHVTDATIPSATLEAQVLPPANLPSLPTITEPRAPTVPTVTLGVHLQALQQNIGRKLSKISAAAAHLLQQFRAVAVPAADKVSQGAAEVAANLRKLAADADRVSSSANEVAGRIGQHAAALAQIAGAVAAARTALATLPAGLCSALHSANLRLSPPAPRAHARRNNSRTPAPTPPPLSKSDCTALVSNLPRLQLLSQRLSTIEGLILTLSGDLNATAGRVRSMQSQLSGVVSSDLSAASGHANDLSQRALALANTISQTTPSRSKRARRPISTKQIGGGARLDAAVQRLDAAISGAAGQVDTQYADLTALDKRARQTQLPGGNATGATVQAGLIVYSVAGANQTQHILHLAAIIGATALLLGSTIGLSLYRIRRGWPSSLAPAKTPSPN